MRRSISLRLIPIAVCVATCTAVLLLTRQTLVSAQGAAPACFGDLNKLTYQNGFASTDFTSTTSVNLGGNIQLNTALSPLNPERIVLPFDQDVRVKSVYFNAGATHTFGWFYLDQISGQNGAPYYFDVPTQTLVDANHNGVPDLYEALWVKGGGTPMLLDGNTNYSDGGNYPHIHNLLEPYDHVNNPTGIGHLIFNIMNDNGATGWTFNYNGVNLPPIEDASSAVDGISDYDVNGDGIVGNEPDRTVDLGVIQGNREVVFYALVYWGQTGKNIAFGLTGSGTQNTGIIPIFSKTVLNIDYGSVGANDTISYIDIGAPAVKSTGSQCEDATPAAGAGGVPTPQGTFSNCNWTPYPGVNNDATQQAQVWGWLDQPTLDRLNTPTYFNLLMPHEVHRVTASPNGSAPHFFVGAPSNDVNRWIVGFEDLLGYTGNSCGGCTQSDFDWNDVVVLIDRINGGQTISQNVATDIPAASLSNTIISRIRVRYTVTLPSPGCDGLTGAGVQIYWSVNNGATWNPLPMANPLTGDVVVDVLASGNIGNTVQWKSVFTSPSQLCQPQLNTLNIGYEAVQHNEFKFAAPIPLANMMYSGTLETPSATWTVTRADYSLRGHFYATEIYDPTAPALLYTGPATWDAGNWLATHSPANRYLFTNNRGAALAFTTGNGGTLLPVAGGTPASLYQQILPDSVRRQQVNGTLLYDFNGDQAVTDTDAQFVLEWTRGWEYPAGMTIFPAPPQQPQQRAWPLGSVHDSSPVLVGPPPHPAWRDSKTTLLSPYFTLFDNFQTTNKDRKALAIVGSQDGLLHGFNAGAFHPNGVDSTLCSVQLQRGCFANGLAGPDYGDGAEQWAYVPPRLLWSLKNNHPQVRTAALAGNVVAEIDGSVSAENILVNGAFTTAVFASLGRNQPYVTALRIDGDPTHPTPLWSDDWTDLAFNGSNFSPGIAAFANTPTGPKSVLVLSSGLAANTTKTYIYLLDAATGKQIVNTGNQAVGKIALDAVGTSYGIGGYPNLVDTDGDGIVDRVYVVDTAGRIYKVDLTMNPPTACKIGSVGDTVYASMATYVVPNTTPPVVKLFLGGGPNPDGSNPPAANITYSLWAMEDDDVLGTCSVNLAKEVFQYPLAAPTKVWAAPAVAGANPAGVFFATATGTSESVCDTGVGTLIATSVTGTPTMYPTTVSQSASLGSEAVSSIRVYDEHVFINTVGGQTKIVGGQGWNNTAAGGTVPTAPSLPPSNWTEY